ncbi:MAG: hypothetical protein NTY10_06160 [Candidatus Omnitrophica bacterium]|nr:hypothetical protein [Candidatus Omnitrophota bacterium]
MANNIGVRIRSGASDWQIFQKDSDGKAVISLEGTYSFSEPQDLGAVLVRVVSENSQIPVCSENDWTPALTQTDKTWSVKIKVPAGGLYRIETSLLVKDVVLEWGLHGDFIHHIGVGDLWVIAGQSNAAGYGRGEVDDGPELGIHILRNDEKWDIASHPLNDTRGNNHPNLEFANPGHSPFLNFAKVLKKTLGYPIGLIQTSLGASPLSQWNPQENPDAPLYRNMLHCIGLSGGKITGVCWYQGCSDTTDILCHSYLERFGQFVESTRRDLNQHNLLFLTAQLNRVCGFPNEAMDIAWSTVREAQRQAAHSLTGVAVIPTIDLPLSDPIHISPSGNIVLGQRFAATALGMYYQRDIPWRFPEICGADARGEKKEVVLSFGNVRHRLHSDLPVVEDFTVEDSRGRVEVEKVEFAGKEKVILRLTRALEGEAFVHNGFGFTPKTSIYEAISLKPLLAFYRFRIT